MPAQCCKMFGRMTLQHSIGSQTNFWTYTTKDTSTGIQSNCWKGSCLSTGWICTTFNAVASNLYPWCFHVVCCVSMFTLHDSTLTIYFEEAVGGLADRVEVSLCPHNGPPPLPIGHERTRVREAQDTKDCEPRLAQSPGWAPCRVCNLRIKLHPLGGG